MEPSYFLLSFVLNLFLAGPFENEPNFRAQTLDHNVSIGYGLAIGDVDGDGKQDILLADKKQFVWYRNGDWKKFILVENVTENDNVCIAARDLNGDGKVEIAVGAQWNPSETADTLKSGSVHFLLRPSNPTDKWSVIALPHEPTVHRMKWVRAARGKYHLIVAPLHGRGNKGGTGQGSKIWAYEFPGNPRGPWTRHLVDDSMHLTHNFDVMDNGRGEWIYLGGKEGVKVFSFEGGKWKAPLTGLWFVQGKSFGEVRVGELQGKQKFLAGIEPMHGNTLTFYAHTDSSSRKVLSSKINQGHALACEDLLGIGSHQIIVGWREPDQDQKVGIKMFQPLNGKEMKWKEIWLDENDIACEDLQVADLDRDGKKEVIASGRSTHNLKIYWNLNK